MVENFKDHRGEVFILPFGNIELLFIKTKKNKKRGGHYHLCDQHHLVLEGTIVLHTVSKNCDTCQILKKGDFVTIKAEVPHYMVSLTNSWFVEWKDQIEKEPHNVPELRKLVEND